MGIWISGVGMGVSASSIKNPSKGRSRRRNEAEVFSTRKSASSRRRLHQEAALRVVPARKSGCLERVGHSDTSQGRRTRPKTFVTSKLRRGAMFILLPATDLNQAPERHGSTGGSSKAQNSKLGTQRPLTPPAYPTGSEAGDRARRASADTTRPPPNLLRSSRADASGLCPGRRSVSSELTHPA